MERIVCVSNFCPSSNWLKKTILQNWHLVKNLDESLKEKTLFAFRKDKSIANHIVRAALPKAKTMTVRDYVGLPPIKGHHKCGTCLCCESTLEGELFTHNDINWKHELFSNCKSKNVIYGILCPCEKLYIGKTNQEIHHRISQHKSRIRKNVQTASLVNHWHTYAHLEKDLLWTVNSRVEYDKRGGYLDAKLIKREAMLIIKFNTAIDGLNELSEIYKL